MKKINILLLVSIIAFGWGCSKDDFADLNTDPSKVREGSLAFSATRAMQRMYNNDYTVWFYSKFQAIYPWVQVSAKSDGNGSDFVLVDNYDSQNLAADLIQQTRDIQFKFEALDKENKDYYEVLKALTYPIQIQPAIAISDYRGSMIYSEAGMAPFTTPALLTPKYDNQETLYNTWLTELDYAIGILKDAEGRYSLGGQDFIYGSDYSKWAKFCNLLKLKIAARLVNTNKAKAIGIAEQVANSDAGYMNSLSEDFIYQPGTKYYGTGSGMWIGAGGRNLVNFMVDNRDPRVRFMYKKNDFNAEVVQALIDGGKELPSYVAQYVDLDADGNFAGWNGPGEPWVRYHGAPVSPDAKLDASNNIYFDQGNLYKIKVKKIVNEEEKEVEKSYTATSLFNEKVVRTSYNYTYPTKPHGRVIELKDNDPGLQVVLGTSAETNLYFAEFKLLGANLPLAAQEYFNRGVQLSVERMDAMARQNQLPYYNSDPVYTDAVEAEAAATKLRDGEITALLSQPAYDLSVDGLEKVYIQQYINFTITPGDVWTTARRAGIPKKNSAYLAWEPFLDSGTEMVIPRRFIARAPLESSKNYVNQKAAVEEQGFTTGVNTPDVLNAERMWFDKESPAYGAGPKN